MSVKFWVQKFVSILCSMAMLWQSLLSVPAYAEISGANVAKQNFMYAFQSQMGVANPSAQDFSLMLNAAKGVQGKLEGQEKADFTEKILNPLIAYNGANKTIDECNCPDGDCSIKNLNLNFNLFQTDDVAQCQRQKSVIDDNFKSFLNSFNAVNLKLVLPSDFKKGGDSQAKQQNLKEFRDLLVAQTQEDLLLPYIKLSRNFRDGAFPGKNKDLLAKLKISAKKEKPLLERMQKIMDEPIQNDKDNNPNSRRDKLFIGFQKELKSIDKIFTEEQDYGEAINQMDRVAPSVWAQDKSWIAPAKSDSELAQKREQIKEIFPVLNYDPKATTVDEVAAPIFQTQTFNVESQAKLPNTPEVIKIPIDRVNYRQLQPKKSRVDESVIPEYLKIKYGILARGQEKFSGNEETRAMKEKLLLADLKKYFMANLLPQKSELSDEDKKNMADNFVKNLDENIESSFNEMRAKRAGTVYSLIGKSAITYDENNPYIKTQSQNKDSLPIHLFGQKNTETENSRQFNASLRANNGLTQEQIIGSAIRASIQNVPTKQGVNLDRFLQNKVSANFHARREIADNLRGNPVFYGGNKGLAHFLYRGDPAAKKEDMQAALDDYFSKTEDLLSELDKNYDKDDPEDQIASILKRNPALVARVLSQNPQYAGMVCDLKKKFLKDKKSSEVWDKIFFGAGMVLMGAAVILTAGATLGVFAVAGAVTAGLGVAGFALGAVGTTRSAMTSAELFEEARQANQYLVSMGVGNKEEVQKLLDEANRKMRDAFIEGGMTLAGGTGLGLTGKIFRYARGKNPAVVKTMLEEAAASKEGAKKLAVAIEDDTKLITHAPGSSAGATGKSADTFMERQYARAVSSNEEVALRALKESKNAKSEVVGVVDTSAIKLQSNEDCYLHSIYHSPQNRALRDRMSYDEFMIRVNKMHAPGDDKMQALFAKGNASPKEIISAFNGETGVARGLNRAEADMLMEVLSQSPMKQVAGRDIKVADDLKNLIKDNEGNPIVLAVKYGEDSSHAVVLQSVVTRENGTSYAIIRDSNSKNLLEVEFNEIKENIVSATSFGKTDAASATRLKEVSTSVDSREVSVASDQADAVLKSKGELTPTSRADLEQGSGTRAQYERAKGTAEDVISPKLTLTDSHVPGSRSVGTHSDVNEYGPTDSPIIGGADAPHVALENKFKNPNSTTVTEPPKLDFNKDVRTKDFADFRRENPGDFVVLVKGKSKTFEVPQRIRTVDSFAKDEQKILRLLDQKQRDPKFASRFAKSRRERTLLETEEEYQKALEQIRLKEASEGVEVALVQVKLKDGRTLSAEFTSSNTTEVADAALDKATRGLLERNNIKDSDITDFSFYHTHPNNEGNISAHVLSPGDQIVTEKMMDRLAASNPDVRVNMFAIQRDEKNGELFAYELLGRPRPKPTPKPAGADVATRIIEKPTVIVKKEVPQTVPGPEASNLRLLSLRERDQQMLQIAADRGIPRGQIETVSLAGDDVVVFLKGGESRKLALAKQAQEVPTTKIIAPHEVPTAKIIAPKAAPGPVRASRPVNLATNTDVHSLREKTMNAISKDYDGAAVLAHGTDQKGIMGILETGHMNRAGRIAVSTGDDKVDEGIIYFTSRKYSAAEYATVSAERGKDATLAGGVIVLKKEYATVNGALPQEAANRGVTHTLSDGTLVRAKDDMYIGINPASKDGLSVHAIEKIYVTPNTYNSVYDKYIINEFRKRGGEALSAPAQQTLLKELEAAPQDAFDGRSINQFLRVVE